MTPLTREEIEDARRLLPLGRTPRHDTINRLCDAALKGLEPSNLSNEVIDAALADAFQRGFEACREKADANAFQGESITTASAPDDIADAVSWARGYEDAAINIGGFIRALTPDRDTQKEWNAFMNQRITQPNETKGEEVIGCMADFSPGDPENLTELMAMKPPWSTQPPEAKGEDEIERVMIALGCRSDRVSYDAYNLIKSLKEERDRWRNGCENAARQRDAFITEVSQLKAENEKLREALSVLSNTSDFTNEEGFQDFLNARDRARAALQTGGTE